MDTIDVEILATVVNNGTGDFDQLTNRPKYNGTTMTHETNVPEVKTASWDAKYVKPVDGIPSSDMTTAVQTSLGKADTALQSHQSLAAYRTAEAQNAIDTGLSNAITAKYSKPATGIPKTDMASDVQTSLGKADSALQEHQSLSAYRTASAQDTIDATKAAASDLTAHTGNTSNPHGVTAEQTVYNSSAQSHTSGSVGAALASQSEQIVTLASSLTNKAATAADEGKFAKVKTVDAQTGKVSEWEFGEGGSGGGSWATIFPQIESDTTPYDPTDEIIYKANQIGYGTSDVDSKLDSLSNATGIIYENTNVKQALDGKCDSDRVLVEMISQSQTSDASIVVPDYISTEPQTASDSGLKGQIYIGTDYVYVCVAANTWKRFAITTF